MRKRSSHTSAACRQGLKVGDRVTIRGGFFKPGANPNKGTPGRIVKWSGCGVAEVRIGRGKPAINFDRGAIYDVPRSYLKKRR